MWLNTSTSTDPSGNGSAVPSPQTNATRSPNRSAALRSPGTSMSMPSVRPAPAAASSSAMNPAEQPTSPTVSPSSGPWKCSRTAMIFAALRLRLASSSIAGWNSEYSSCFSFTTSPILSGSKECVGVGAPERLGIDGPDARSQPFGVLVEPLDRLAQRLDVIGLDQQAVDAVADVVGQRADPGRDHRHPV